MPNTYTKLYIQIVFSVRFRHYLISEANRPAIEKYITGIVKNHKSRLLAIYCNPDHIHIFIHLSPDISISSLVRIIKTNSSKWINETWGLGVNFQWQEGYGAFSYPESAVSNVCNYIKNQAIHHKGKNFEEEFIKLLEKYNIKFDKKYLPILKD